MIPAVICLRELKDSNHHKGRIFKSPDKPSYVIDQDERCYEKCQILIALLFVENEKTISEDDDTDNKHSQNSWKYCQKLI